MVRVKYKRYTSKGGKNLMLMTWTFNTGKRAVTMLDRFCNKMEQVGLFHFVVNVNGDIIGEIPHEIKEIVIKHPKVVWLLTIQNENTSGEVMNNLLNNIGGARDSFYLNLLNLIQKYNYCQGIDIDFENCGSKENRQKMINLITGIKSICYVYEKKLNLCLPPITAPFTSVGGEYWCAYEDYADLCDTMALMSYSFAWLGSAPGPVSPDWWLEEIVEYAKSVVDSNKIIIGIGAWAIMWALHKKYNGYCANGGTYYWLLQWMLGMRNFYDFKDGAEREYEDDRQVKVPFCSYWDDNNKICYMMPYVYDVLESTDYISKSSNLYEGTLNYKPYLVAYNKQVDSGTCGSVTYQGICNKLNVDENTQCEPYEGYAVTIEVLRRDPDSKMILYDDFRWESKELFEAYYDVSGHYSLSGRSLVLSGGVAKYNQEFADGCHVKVRLTTESEAGVSFGQYSLTYEKASRRLMLKNDGELIAEYAYSYGNYAEFAIRVRNSSLRIYADGNLIGTMQGTFNGIGKASMIGCGAFSLFRLGDAWWYEPYECLNVTVNGSYYKLGRIQRSNVVWDGEYFRLMSDVEERTTRTEEISKDWSYLYCGLVQSITTDVQVDINIEPVDINVWIGRTYIGDNDGFGIMYYEDSNVILHWYNRAKYEYGIRGLCMWTLGQEDCRIWEQIL